MKQKVSNENIAEKHYSRNKRQWEESRHDDRYVATKHTIDTDKRKHYLDEPKLTK